MKEAANEEMVFEQAEADANLAVQGGMEIFEYNFLVDLRSSRR